MDPNSAQHMPLWAGILSFHCSRILTSEAAEPLPFAFMPLDVLMKKKTNPNQTFIWPVLHPNYLSFLKASLLTLQCRSSICREQTQPLSQVSVIVLRVWGSLWVSGRAVDGEKTQIHITSMVLSLSLPSQAG